MHILRTLFICKHLANIMFSWKTMFFYFCQRWNLKTGRTLFQGTFCFVCISRVVGTCGNYISLLLVLRKTEHVSSAGAARAFRPCISRAHSARGNNMGKLCFVTPGFSQNRACQCCWGGARVSRAHFACAFRARPQHGETRFRYPSFFAKPSMSVLLGRRARFARGRNMGKLCFVTFVFRKTEHVSAAETAWEARYWRRRAAGAGALLAQTRCWRRRAAGRGAGARASARAGATSFFVLQFLNCFFRLRDIAKRAFLRYFVQQN